MLSALKGLNIANAANIPANKNITITIILLSIRIRITVFLCFAEIL